MENKEILKNTIIALSQVNDMPIPQRLFEIKDLLKKEIWNNTEFVDKVFEIKHKIETTNYDIELIEYIEFKKMKDEEKPDPRVFHYFKKIKDQLACAILFHEESFLLNLHDFYKTRNKEIRSNLGITQNTTNYGNISSTGIHKIKCDDTSNIFRPFYIDWRKKWKQFLNRISKLSEENTLLLKIDFQSAYQYLDVNSFSDDDLSYSSIKLLVGIANKYKKVKNNLGEKISGIPYGGPVESHMVANYLILQKLNKIAKILQNKGFEIIDIISYADDSCILVKNQKDNYDREKINSIDREKINSIISDEIKELKMHKFSKNDKSKSYIFKIEKISDYLKVREAYTSLSTINSFFLASDLSDKPFVEAIKEDRIDPKNKKSKTQERIERKYYFHKIDNLLSYDHLFNDQDLRNFISYNKSPKYIPYFFAQIISKFKSKRDKQESIEWFIRILKAKGHSEQLTINFNDSNLELFKHFSPQEILKVLILLKEKNDLIGFKLLAKKLEESTLFNKSKDNKFFGTFKLVQETYELFSEWSDFDNDNNFPIPIWQEGNFNQKLSEIINDKLISLNSLVKHIKWVATLNGCQYLKININDLPLFDGWIKNGNNPKYWSFTKKILSYTFSKLFEKNSFLLFFRYLRLLESSENRIEYIENMQYLNEGLDSLSDLNEMILSDIDLSYIKLLTSSPQILSDDTHNFMFNNDKLILIRMFVKLVWENGSLSTQSFTSHNHFHGDTLLKRFVNLKSKEKVGELITINNIDIFPLLASFYLHDLGMLLNVDSDTLFNDEIKIIYSKIANKARSEHGTKSSEIILTKVGSLLHLPQEWMISISQASIAHQKGTQELVFGDDKTKNNALILSIIDLFDITFERSSILARLLTGDSVSNESIQHWQKHYISRSIAFDLQKQEDIYKFIIHIDLNKNILKQYKFQNKIKSFIKKELIKWFKPNAKLLVENILGYVNFSIDVHIEWHEVDFPENHKYGFYKDNNPGFVEKELDNILKRSEYDL